ncbi:MAG: hypothetical protein WBV53_03660, partial [Solirubrobacterales bacterium]
DELTVLPDQLGLLHESVSMNDGSPEAQENRFSPVDVRMPPLCMERSAFPVGARFSRNASAIPQSTRGVCILSSAPFHVSHRSGPAPRSRLTGNLESSV